MMLTEEMVYNAAIKQAEERINIAEEVKKIHGRGWEA